MFIWQRRNGFGRWAGLAPLHQAFVAAQALAAPKVAPANAFDPKDGVEVALQTLGQQSPVTEPAIG
jgi:hypothetical protein